MATATLQLSFDIDGELAATRVVMMREERRLGRPAELLVRCEFPLAQDPRVLLGHVGTLRFGRSGSEPRVFKGIIESATVIASTAMGGTGVHHAELRVTSLLAPLAHVVTCQIFQELDVKEIVGQLLEQHGLPAAQQDWRLTASYPKRTYCVQYDESVLDFATRLLEEEGIYYFSELGEDGETVVFADDSTSAEALPGESHELPFRQSSGSDAQADHVLSIEERHRVVSGKFVLRDYDFTRPELDQTCEAASDVDDDLERYDYPGGYTEPSEGRRLVRVRLEAEQVMRLLLHVSADCPRLVPGKKIAIADALHESIDGEYLVVAVNHFVSAERTAEQQAPGDAGQTAAPSPDGAGQQAAPAQQSSESYRVEAVLLPIAVPYRLEPATLAPVMEGPQTAQVVAPAGSRPEEIHTDEWGRSKVRFFWDLAGITDERASCWMRTKQLQTSGSMILPRIDWEVVVEYLEGNVDRPIVTGRMYNGVFMPPYALPEGRSRTSFQSASTPGGGGSNEIRFEDKAGGEEIYIHCQYDMTVNAANNKAKSIGNQEAKKVGVDSTITVGSNEKIQITKGARATVGADQSITVGANRKVEVNALQALKVGGNSTSSIGANQFEMDGDPLTALINLAVEKATEMLQAKADEMLGQIDAYVQDKVGQVMGPINDLQARVGQVADAMDLVSQGNLGEVSTALREAASIPGAAELGQEMQQAAFGTMQGVGSEMGVEVEQPGEDATRLDQQIGLDQVVNGAIAQGVRMGGDAVDAGLHDLFGEALGLDASGGGGASAANLAGPELDLAGIDETDRETGPGHSLTIVDGNVTESVGSLRISGAITGINTEVAGSVTQTVGIGRAELVLGNRTETVDGSKTEQCVGLVVLSKGDVSEKVSGSKTSMVGGAVVDLIKGSQTVEAGGPATFIGALHKVEAKEKITFQVGGSTVVVDGGGVTIEAPIVAVLSSKIQVTKNAAENG